MLMWKRGRGEADGRLGGGSTPGWNAIDFTMGDVFYGGYHQTLLLLYTLLLFCISHEDRLR